MHNKQHRYGSRYNGGTTFTVELDNTVDENAVQNKKMRQLEKETIYNEMTQAEPEIQGKLKQTG